jgi:putative transposase
MIARFWGSIKYEDIYLKCYENAWELEKGKFEYKIRYNSDRPDQSLREVTPDEVYEGVVKLVA